MFCIELVVNLVGIPSYRSCAADRFPNEKVIMTLPDLGFQSHKTGGHLKKQHLKKSSGKKNVNSGTSKKSSPKIITKIIQNSSVFSGCSFFFLMDVLGTLSMVFEISFLLGGGAVRAVLLRSARAAKLGARAGRIFKLVMCYSLLIKGNEGVDKMGKGETFLSKDWEEKH